jgi:hypothetical protein
LRLGLELVDLGERLDQDVPQDVGQTPRWPTPTPRAPPRVGHLSHCVDPHGSGLEVALAHAVQRRDRLLLLVLHRTGSIAALRAASSTALASTRPVLFPSR